MSKYEVNEKELHTMFKAVYLQKDLSKECHSYWKGFCHAIAAANKDLYYKFYDELKAEENETELEHFIRCNCNRNK